MSAPTIVASCSPLCTVSSFSFNDPSTTEIYTLSLHDALPIYHVGAGDAKRFEVAMESGHALEQRDKRRGRRHRRSEEHTSELQSRRDLVCRLLLEKKKEGADRLQQLE